MNSFGGLFRAGYRRVKRQIAGAGARTSRRHIPDHLGVDGFFAELKSRHVRYAVLRWFDNLPYVAPGSDVDILVHDGDARTVAGLLDGGPGCIPCDFYSMSGLPGSSYHETPYLPPISAENLLARATTRADLYRIPCPEDHFLSLAFHAVYHKGLKSGLPTRHSDLTSQADPKHDYPAVLAALAQELGITVDIAMEPLGEYLAQRGWSPTAEMLSLLERRNPWVRALSAERAAEFPMETGSRHSDRPR